MNEIPVGRVLDRLDKYLESKDFDSAARHLKYWVSETEALNDRRGRLTLLNEQIGLYRRTGKKDEGLAAVEAALSLSDDPELSGSVSLGTTLINAATAYKAFGNAGAALPLYERAREIYEARLLPEDGRLAALYNNMALTLTELGNYPKARELFERALEVMALNEHGETDMAITCCNLADLAAAEFGTIDGETAIAEQLEKAFKLLDSHGLPRDRKYADTCEKCAPGFGYYGFFIYEQELMKRAKEIYERS